MTQQARIHAPREWPMESIKQEVEASMHPNASVNRFPNFHTSSMHTKVAATPTKPAIVFVENRLPVATPVSAE